MVKDGYNDVHVVFMLPTSSIVPYAVVFDNIVTDVQCFPPGNAVPLVSKSVNKSIVEEEVVEFSCVFGGNYDPIDYTVIWSVTPHNGNATFIDDESDIADFEVTKPQQNCPHGNYSCCKFTTELKIHSNMSLNGAAVTCLVLVLEQPTSDTSYLSEFLFS